jgi:hypothetical protein
MRKISISIPKPCHENWDVMRPEAYGRYCGSCEKTVIDFSNMSDRALVQFFKQPTGLLCGRFMPDQLDRVIEVPRKRIPWLRYFFTIALPAFLVSCKFAGRKPGLRNVQNTEQRITGDTIIVKPHRLQMIGMLVPIPIDSASKAAKQKQDKSIQSIKKCKVQAIQKDRIGFSAAPFVFHPIVLKEEGDNASSDITNELKGMMGKISISRTPIKNEKLSKLLLKQRVSLSTSSFTVYPNPVLPGSLLTLDVKLMEQGSYVVSIINTGGVAVQRSKIELNKEAKSLQLNLKALTAGYYFVVLTNTNSSKRYTELLKVQ